MAGGYFRARISTLSAFDKVVGGVVWSITASGVEVDVDIIFQENSTIGQKIKLADQLVKALVKMRSPHPLQSHQIQGLDYDHLFPVLQWLVRKVIEHRRLTGDLIRAQSLSNFGKSYQLPRDLRTSECVSLVTGLSTTYSKPQRKFRKKVGSSFESEASRTEATLLEYGERIQALVGSGEDEEKAANQAERASKGGARSALVGKFETDASGANASEKDAAARAELERKEQARLEALQTQLSAAGLATRISGQNVGQLVGLQSAEIAKAAADYEEMMKRNEESMNGEFDNSKRGQEAAFQRQLEAMRRKIAQAKEVAEKRETASNEIETKRAELQARFQKEEKRLNKIHTETAKLEVLEGSDENKNLLQQLRSLVTLNENLKQQEVAFKDSCMQQRKDYKDQLARLDPSSSSSSTDVDDEETRRMKAIEAMYNKEFETLNKLRRVLAKKNQELASLRRRIDEVPTRAELLQFQHRFVELYELSSEKHIETKKFYELYNSINSSYEFMQTEVKLLNNIIESFPSAVLKGSLASRSDFLTKFEGILSGVSQNKVHVEKEIENVNMIKENLNQKYMAAVDQQRLYVKLKKEFREESMKNEKLTEMKEELEQKQQQQQENGTEGQDE